MQNKKVGGLAEALMKNKKAPPLGLEYEGGEEEDEEEESGLDMGSGRVGSGRD